MAMINSYCSQLQGKRATAIRSKVTFPFILVHHKVLTVPFIPFTVVCCHRSCHRRRTSQNRKLALFFAFRLLNSVYSWIKYRHLVFIESTQVIDSSKSTLVIEMMQTSSPANGKLRRHRGKCSYCWANVINSSVTVIASTCKWKDESKVTEKQVNYLNCVCDLWSIWLCVWYFCVIWFILSDTWM